MKNLQEFLKQKGFSGLYDNLAIRMLKYPDRVVLNYNQFDTPKNDPLANLCRGLILDNNYNVISRAYDRFYNLGENDVFDFPFEESVIMAKEDGSLFVLYSDMTEEDKENENWNFATRGTAFSELSISEGGITPYGILKEITGINRDKLLSSIQSDLHDFREYTFIFELCSLHNKVIKSYEVPKLFLTGIRNKFTGEYMNYSMMKEMTKLLNSFGLCCELVKVYPFISKEEILKAFDDMNEFSQLDEGIVAWNQETGERIKLKREQYVNLHLLKGENNFTMKRCSNIIFSGEVDEILAYFPEYTERFEFINQRIDETVYRIEQEFDRIKHIKEQKDFALEATKTPFAHILFRMRYNLQNSEVVPVRDIIKGMRDEQRMKLIGAYEKAC